MLYTQGIFFDGVSSVPQEILIEFDEKQGHFIFDKPVLHAQIWAADEVHCEFLNKVLHISFREGAGVATIQITDHQFINDFYKILHQSGKLSLYQRLLSFSLGTYVAIGVCVLALMGVFYWYGVPYIGEKAANWLPTSYDNYLGNMAYQQYTVVANIDSIKSEQLTQFAYHLNLNNEKPLKFSVIESSMVNAFALPNGQIVVFTGILEQMEHYSELAALLGHEAAHVNHRHSIKMLCRNIAGYIVISAVLGDANGVMAIISEHTQDLQSLSYSRNFEREADESGLQTLLQNNIDPKGMVDLFTHLQSYGDDLVRNL
ncbi:MAG: M48 family metallopeptidase [Sphingobacteriales bacterium]|nr:M48 family metallopeptidase [Sphingobacteriales bacterium]